MGEPNTSRRHFLTALSNVRRVSLRSLLGTSGVYRKAVVAPIPESKAWWRALDHTPTRDEWSAVEEAIRASERARLAAAVQAKVGAQDANYRAGLWDAIAIING